VGKSEDKLLHRELCFDMEIAMANVEGVEGHELREQVGQRVFFNTDGFHNFLRKNNCNWKSISSCGSNTEYWKL